MKRFTSILLAILFVGCGIPKKPNAVRRAFSHAGQSTAQAQAVVPAIPSNKIGCAWDYGEQPPGLFFQVWGSTNLVDWYWLTNTVSKVALFDQKPMEFYRVRAIDTNGLVSQWGTVGK